MFTFSKNCSYATMNCFLLNKTMVPDTININLDSPTSSKEKKLSYRLSWWKDFINSEFTFCVFRYL